MASNKERPGSFAGAVRRFAGRCSRGELEALKAICQLCYFSALIDELSFGAAWDVLSHVHGDTRRLLATCILNVP